MTHQEFMRIANAIFGANLPRGWQTQFCKMAQSLGYSLNGPTISLLSRDENKSVHPKTTEAIRAVADAYASGRVRVPNNVGLENESSLKDDPEDSQTDEEILEEIISRAEIFRESINEIMLGNRHGAIIGGPPGWGKSFEVEKQIHKAKGVVKIIGGGISSPGIIRTFWETRNGGVVAFDDCDDIFDDETKCNLFKCALDTKQNRTISWIKERSMVDSFGEEIEKSFSYNGSIIVLTNKNIDKEIEKENKLSDHFKAIRSRAGFMSLGIFSLRSQILWLRHICENESILDDNGIHNPEDKKEIVDFVVENANKFSFVSLRLVTNIARYKRTMPVRWKAHAKAFFMKSK